MMTIDGNIRDKKLSYDNRVAANISAFSSANVDKYELWENSGCFDDHDLLIKGFTQTNTDLDITALTNYAVAVWK